jgi:hypothetical protein
MAKKASEIKDESMYRFCGEGLGIPVLPHELTGQQAKEMDMLEVLQAAVKNGNYRSVKQVHEEIASGGKTPPSQ